jgi:D-serine deaminase-like pyridoxal phosphate-dependent protein
MRSNLLPETPFLVLDVDLVKENTKKMSHRLAKAGVSLRPHVKTAKCLEVALIASGGQPGPITVSTLKEAEQFAGAGFNDILYAVGMIPSKLEHCRALIEKGLHLSLICDNVDSAQALSAFGTIHNLHLPCLIEIDVDSHRSGVKPNDIDTLTRVGNALGRNLCGVMTHAGDSYNAHSVDAISAAAELERLGVVTAANHLRAIGLPCPVVSVGSTPTATFGKSFEGVTEVRAGVYMFQDLVMAGLGVCGYSDIALSVITSVIGHRKDMGWLLTDAGWMAMSRDRGTAKQALDQGYGVVCTIDGVVIADLIVSGANQEHGIVSLRENSAAGKTLRLEEYPIGTLLRVLPNHACATAAQFDEYHLISGRQANGFELVGTWPRFRGW